MAGTPPPSGPSAIRVELLGIVFLFTLLAGIYASRVPPLEGPDAGSHFRYIVFLAENWQRPSLTSETANYAHELVQQPPLYYGVVAALLTPFDPESALVLEQPNVYYGLGLSSRATITDTTQTWTTALPIWIARVVSMLGGILAAVSTFLLIRLLLSDQPTLAWAGTAVLAFNPQFLFTAQTVTNDTFAAGFSSLTMLAAVAVFRRWLSGWGWAAVGVCAGLAALSKYSAALVILPVAFVFLLDLVQIGWKQALRAGLLLALGGGLVAGPWFLPNLLQLGTPIPTNAMLVLLPDLARPEPLSWAQALDVATWLRRSYWGVYGYGVLSSQSYYQLTSILMAGGGVGLVWLMGKSLARWRRRGWAGVDVPQLTALCMSSLWAGGVFVGLLAWIRVVRFTDQGRLLFPAATALALLLILGWQAFFPLRWRKAIHLVMVTVMLGMALSQIPVLARAYTLPPGLDPLPKMDRTINADFEAGMTLVGVDLPAGAGADAGGELPITFYWQARHKIDDFYTLFVHLVGPDDRMIVQLDVVPGAGTHPTRQWIAGETFADAYVLPIPEDVGEMSALLSAGFYPVHAAAGQDRQPIMDGSGAAIGDRVVITPIRIHTGPVEPSADPPLAVWAGGIELAEAAFVDDGTTITLTWQATAIIHTDYTVFVQALNSAGELVAQIDRKPQDGRLPTLTWRAGDRIADRLAFETLPDDWQRVIVGLYDSNGLRLPLTGEQTGQDYYTIFQQD